MKNTEKNEDTKKAVNKGPLIGIIIAVTAVAGFLWFDNARKWETTEDAYVETTLVSVAPKVSGHIVRMYVQDNQEVKEGDLVAEIDSDDYSVRLSQASAVHEAAILNQKNAKANFSAVNSRINLAKKNLDRFTELYKSGAVSKLEYDNIKTEYDNAKAALTGAEENLLSNKNSVANADLKQLAALKKQAELNLSYTKIYAPISGHVSGKTTEKGTFIQAGQPLFTIVPQDIWIVANFKENQLANMKAGQEVEIKVDAYHKKAFKGKVDSIQRISGAKASLFPPENAVGSFVKIVQRIPVKIIFVDEINTAEYTIVPGMSVEPKVRVR